jgi:hypothetical protein
MTTRSKLPKPKGVTDSEIDALLRSSRERRKTATTILAARYDAKTDMLAVNLSTGVALIVPRKKITGFAKAAPSDLSDLKIDVGAESLWSDTVDDGVLLEQLIEITAGSEDLAAFSGRILGRRKTPARAAASRANGKKGGRPRKNAKAKVRKASQVPAVTAT